MESRGPFFPQLQETREENRDLRTRLKPLNNFVADPKHINALPIPLRKYIHDLKTRSDPAGDVQSIAILKENVKALEAKLERGRTVLQGLANLWHEQGFERCFPAKHTRELERVINEVWAELPQRSRPFHTPTKIGLYEHQTMGQKFFLSRAGAMDDRDLSALRMIGITLAMLALMWLCDGLKLIASH